MSAWGTNASTGAAGGVLFVSALHGATRQGGPFSVRRRGRPTTERTDTTRGGKRTRPVVIVGVLTAQAAGQLAQTVSTGHAPP